DSGIRVAQRLPDLVAGEEPVVDDAEHEWGRAPPADRVPVRDLPGLDEETAALQRLDDGCGDLVRRQPGELAEPRQQMTRLVDRHDDRQVVDPRELEVLRAAA